MQVKAELETLNKRLTSVAGGGAFGGIPWGGKRSKKGGGGGGGGGGKSSAQARLTEAQARQVRAAEPGARAMDVLGT